MALNDIRQSQNLKLKSMLLCKLLWNYNYFGRIFQWN